MALVLAAVLWPLMSVFLWWALRLPRRERNRSLCVLATGAMAGIALVILFRSPTLVRQADEYSLWTGLFRSRMWLHYAVAAPLGALIAVFLSREAQ